MKIQSFIILPKYHLKFEYITLKLVLCNAIFIFQSIEKFINKYKKDLRTTFIFIGFYKEILL